MRLIRFCINRPVTMWMIMSLAIILGVLSINSMKVELLPDISVPTLVVVTKMVKAGPGEVEDKITSPLEDALNGVMDLKTLTSRSQEGVSQIKLEFAWGVNLDLAVMEDTNGSGCQPDLACLDTSQEVVDNRRQKKTSIYTLNIHQLTVMLEILLAA